MPTTIEYFSFHSIMSDVISTWDTCEYYVPLAMFFAIKKYSCNCILFNPKPIHLLF